MNTNNILFSLLLIVSIILLIKLFINYNESEYITSSVDNKKYLIRNLHTSDKKNIETANTLAIINQKVTLLINTLSTHNELYFIKHLRENFNGNAVSEAAIDHSQTSYTINKQSIHLCLRSRDHKQALYDINDLMYVVIHELGHMCNYTEKGEPIQGHGPEFKIKFRFLINEALKLGIYEYHDYSKSPKHYCGMKITSNIID
jgi:hypothetical protein